MRDIFFPFDKVRPVQEEMLKDVVSAIENKKDLIAHAPTGLGKTAAALSAAVSLAFREGYTVFFLTPKHTQHTIAIETLRKIKEKHGVNIRAADLIGKKWMCSVDNIENLSSKEFQEYCRDLRKEERCPFFNNVWGDKSQLKGAASDFIVDLQRDGPLHYHDVIERAKDKEFCSYEIAALLAKKSQVVIADYYHLFHPRVRDALLTRLKKEIRNSIIIVDEGHNLPGRIRDILSVKLNSIILGRAAREARAYRFDELSLACEHMSGVLDWFADKIEKYDMYVKKEEVVEEIEKMTGYGYDQLISDLDAAAIEVRKDSRRSFMSSVASFLEDWEGDDAGFARILKKKVTSKGTSFVSLEYSCLNPAISSGDVIQESVSTVLMSGTLVPGEMYKDLLGFDSRAVIKEYPSPFPSRNRLVMIDPAFTTKYSERNKELYDNIAEECARVVNNVKHNSAVFFPSYAILNKVGEWMDGRIMKPMFVEKQDLKKRQRAELLEDFKNSAEKGSVLLGVQGASFAEGIDYPGKLLECVVVVGVPLGTPDLETKALIDYYEHKFGRGWDYGYIYPAMTRALQAAGRCIRSEEDKGAIVFMDKRYTWGNYLKCIPPEWQPKVTRLSANKIKDFFR
jgi:DNA excision repair protein ERCC-2